MLTVTSARPDKIIIFGASGFNRQFVVEEAQSAEGPSGSLKWALAGQSRQWLEGGLNHASKSDAPYVLYTSLTRKEKQVYTTCCQ
jgi:short subunit dehydrogenase-like uncharacterized protein